MKTLKPTDAAGNELLLSKGHASFQALVDAIEKRRATLAEWEAFGIVFNRRYGNDYVPLRTKLDAVRIQLLHSLDQSYDTKGLTKGERQTIAELITLIAEQVLASVDDVAVEELHRRYRAPQGGDTSPGGDVIGQLGGPGGHADDGEREREAARAAYHAKRKKTPKRGSAQERARAEEAEIHRSIRDIYRKLASALHPDRERDPVERERKAGLMQRVNVAYASRSLLDLLDIQQDLEHIDHAALDKVSDERLGRWNTILEDQLRGLDQELADIKAGYVARCGMDPTSSVSPKTVKRVLTSSIEHLRELVMAFEQDVRMLDTGGDFKAWLKHMKGQLAGM